jgi:hypothetical protein
MPSSGLQNFIGMTRQSTQEISNDLGQMSHLISSANSERATAFDKVLI